MSTTRPVGLTAIRETPIGQIHVTRDNDTATHIELYLEDEGHAATLPLSPSDVKWLRRALAQMAPWDTEN